MLGNSVRWIISLLLCAAWIAATKIVVNEGAVTEFRKRVYNTITTGIGLALVLNIASAFKDMALTMRWPILAGKPRNLIELDLVLRADSLAELSKLVFATRRWEVITASIFWLCLNIAAKAGIAAISLTYGFDTDTNSALVSSGTASIPLFDHYYPDGGSTNITEQFEDESFVAYQYGLFVPILGISNTTITPAPGERYQPNSPLLFYNDPSAVLNYIFMDSSMDRKVSVFTERNINLTSQCESRPIIANGNGSYGYPVVEGIGEIYIQLAFNQSSTFFNNDNTTCGDSGDTINRCTVIEVVETSETKPWYYRCNITLGHTQNDSSNVSFISDDMALFTTAAIAQGGSSELIGGNDNVLQVAQLIPQNSFFGRRQFGDAQAMGWKIAYFSLGALAIAGQYNPSTYFQSNMVPSQGQQLTIGHDYWFIGTLAVLLIAQAILISIVAFWANNVKVREESPMELAAMLRPMVDKLDDISKHGKKTKAFKRAKKQTFVRYEKDVISNEWSLKIKS